MIKDFEIIGLCKYIIKIIQTVCIKNEFVVAYFDSKTGKILNLDVNTDDIADYLLFIIWFSKLANRKDILKWAINQFELQRKYLQTNCGLYAKYKAGYRLPWKTNFQVIDVKYQEDYPIGSIPSYLLTNNKIFLEGTKSFLDGVIKYAIDGSGCVCNRILPALKLRYPEASSECSGLFIEGMVDMFTVTGKNIYLKASKSISHTLIENPSFKKYGFFPNGWNTILWVPTRCHKKSKYRFEIMKPNTNSIFGLLSLYRTTNEIFLEKTIKKWLNSMKKMEYSRGVFYNMWDVSKKKASGIVDKTANHAILDVLIESSKILDENKYLKWAIAGSKWWIKKNEEGLIPDGIRGQREWENSMIDSHADLTIVFLKLYQITMDKEFLEVALNNLKALNFFKDKYGLALKVNTETNEISDTRNKAKFLGGCLKALLTGYITLKNEKIYKDKLLRMLTRDR